jgi:hypothetical protein
MAENNDMVTLNIYNQPPPQLANEKAQDLNLNTDKPRNPLYFDNIRNNQGNNYNSAPRDNRRQSSQNSDESSDTSYNNQRNIPVAGAPPQYIQYPRPVYQPIVGQPNRVVAPIATPVMAPYNMPYAQPVVMPPKQVNYGNTTPAVNNAPKTIIIKEEKRVPKSSKGEDCCAGILAGCAACCALCCMAALCCPGPGPHRHYGPRRW